MLNSNELVIVDCPRDAIQGMKKLISAEKKAIHINNLLRSNLFDWIDFGSFVSPHAVPQMADSKEVLDKVEPGSTKLLAIVVNERGAMDASTFDKITYLGYPFSISEIFQTRNTHSTIEASFEKLKKIVAICAHFHSEKINSLDKIRTAFDAGCRKFDGAILGFGGCPFANNDMVGNIPTEDLLRFFKRGTNQQIVELQTSFQNMIA